MIRLVLFFSFVISLSAQGQLFSELHLKLYDNAPFTLVVDNQCYRTPSNNFVLKNLLPGQHYLQVVRTYALIGKYPNYNCNSFSGLINIPYGVTIYGHIDPDNAFNIIKMFPVVSGFPYDRSNRFPNQPVDAVARWDNGSFNLQKEESYKRLKAILEKTASSNLKMQIIKQALTFNQVKSEQVADLMLFLDFDSERIEIAKYAYYFTIDKENFYLVNSAFIFSTSSNEIGKYIYTYAE